ncbi:MAG TPA: hypothetical protein VGF21_01985 [Thermoleophilaceae bacterium]
MSFLHASELVGRLGAGNRERITALRRMSPAQRLDAYRRGEFDFDTCSTWAAAYPHEVPLINGEFEFIARLTPEVLD